MSLKLYIIGRERRQGDRPIDRERRAYRGRAALEFVGLPDRTVSRRHAVIYVTDHRIYMRDLGSKNGTFVLEDAHPRRFNQGYVRPDQQFWFGDYRCRVDDLIEDRPANGANATPASGSG